GEDRSHRGGWGEARELCIGRRDEKPTTGAIGGSGRAPDKAVDGRPQAEDQGDAERSSDDPRVTLRRTTGQGDAADELGPNRGDHRRIEVTGNEDRRLPRPAPA